MDEKMFHNNWFLHCFNIYNQWLIVIDDWHTTSIDIQLYIPNSILLFGNGAFGHMESSHCWGMICSSDCQTIASKCAKPNVQSNWILCLKGAVDRHISRHITWYIVRVSFESRSSVRQVSSECWSSFGQVSVYISAKWPSNWKCSR